MRPSALPDIPFQVVRVIGEGFGMKRPQERREKRKQRRYGGRRGGLSHEQRRERGHLHELDVQPSKRRGQNFIVDPSVIQRIVEFGAPTPDEQLVEIGPGLGALTEALAHASQLTLVEIEEKFCHELALRFPRAKVVCADVRTVLFAELGANLVVFGNLPYAFSTDILFHLVEQGQALKRAILLLQREFAERLASPPGGRVYGTMSVTAQLWADIRLGPIISGSSFYPPAAVESRVVELQFLRSPRFAVPDRRWFTRVVKAAFHRRRRQLHNSLKESGAFVGVDIEALLKSCGVDPSRRAETLSVEEYARLANALHGASPATQS